MVGRTISHYKVLSEVGRGGMGVVYKAEDTKLKRPVALKFLRSDVLEDEEHKERFLREAQAAAALDHPNICTVHEIDEVDGETFIAMAYLEGQTVKDKIAERPLKLEEALDIAIQTAQGLKAAHQKEIVHRDIKPANLMLIEEDLVKIMDFGLAQLAEQSRLTKTATFLGTPAYMSPEQAQRLPTDRRTDIWSLGVVIFEMVTGCLPFEGERQEAVLYAIGNEEPELPSSLRSRVPLELDRIVEKALAKSPDERYQHVEEMIVDLRGLGKKLESGESTILRTGAQAVLASQQPAVPNELVPKQKHRILQAALAVSALVALALAFVYFRQSAPEAPLRRFTFRPPSPIGTTNYDANVAISPNGKHIAFVAESDGKLWVQDLDQRQPRVIEGTEGAVSPFWSPSSDFIGFATAGELKKVSLQGGLPSRLCELPGSHFHGGSWSPDGQSIVFGSNPHVLYEVPARGGAPSVLVERSPEGPAGAIVWPHFLPSEAGARVLVFTFGSSTAMTMMVQNVETGQRELLGPSAAPFYSPSGHLVYQSAPFTHDLWALPFSLDTLRATGEAFPISENGRGPTVAADQTLVYLDGSGQRQLVWLDRHGEKTRESGVFQEEIRYPALSPDERLVAVTAAEGSNEDVWVYDVTRGVKTRLSTDPGGDWRPVWSPAGDQVAFTSNRAGNMDIFLRQTDGGGEEQVLAATPLNELVSDWSQDGNYLLYQINNPGTGADLWYLERNENGSGWGPHPFLQTPFGGFEGRFSPDGRYVAYMSSESGQTEVYVQPFPEGGRKVTVSSNGGRKVHWSRDGKELFYVEGQTLVAVEVSSGSSFSVGEATRLFEHPGFLMPSNDSYDISTDGQRFILAQSVGEGPDAPEPSIRVVMNWFAEFRGHEQD